MASNQENFWEALATLVSAFVGLGILGGIGVFCYQAYIWLRSSYWIEISIVAALKWMGVEWASFPHNWLGLHSLLNATPLSAALIVVGLVVVFLKDSYDSARK